jgi:predicted  nucleic acid-binding Zn ribbon protein
MNDIGQTLLRMKKEIEALKQQEAKKQGEIDACKKQLKELGCKNEEDAENKILKLESEIEKLEKQLEKEMNAIESELYGDVS